MRAWAKREDKKTLSIDTNDYFESFFPTNSNPLDFQPNEAYQYSFVGPLSMQKGCDSAFHMYSKIIDSVRGKPKNNGVDYATNKLSYRGK